MPITLSIIVPVYNVESYIEECLDSILACDFSDKELILVNDGSTDNSYNILLKYSNNEKIRLINKSNGGLSDARNKGLLIAKGRYVCFFDSDDFIDSNSLDRITKRLHDDDCDVIVADYYEFNGVNYTQKRIRKDKTLFSAPLISESERLSVLFNIDVSFAVWNKIYRHSFLVENNLYFKKDIWFEDLDFVFRAFYAAQKIGKSNELLYAYRQRDGSITKSIDVRILDKLAVLNSIKTLLEKDNKMLKYENGFRILYLKIAFSIFYILMRKRKGTANVKQLINAVFDDMYFQKCLSEKLLNFPCLKVKEKIFYLFLKYKIINKRIIYLYSNI